MPRRCSRVQHRGEPKVSLQTTAAIKDVATSHLVITASRVKPCAHDDSSTEAGASPAKVPRRRNTTSAARVATEDGQLHLQLTKNIRRGDCVLEVPLDACVTIDRARAMPWLQTAEDNAGEAWDPWCGDASLLAACLLRDDLPREWIASLPQDLWLPLLDPNEPPSCSARDLGALRENAVDDMQWLVDNTGENWDDFMIALAWVISRSVEVPDVGLCLAPGMDLVDHDDLLDPFEEDLLCELGPRGPGNIMLPGSKTVRFLAPEDRSKGEKLVASYGALPAAAYLERYGFCLGRERLDASRRRRS